MQHHKRLSIAPDASQYDRNGTLQHRDVNSNYRDVTPHHRDVASQHRDVTSHHKDVTSHHRDVTSSNQQSTLQRRPQKSQYSESNPTAELIPSNRGNGISTHRSGAPSPHSVIHSNSSRVPGALTPSSGSNWLNSPPVGVT